MMAITCPGPDLVNVLSAFAGSGTRTAVISGVPPVESSSEHEVTDSCIAPISIIMKMLHLKLKIFRFIYNLF